MPSSQPNRPSATPHWRTVNITLAERLGRIMIGIAAIVSGGLLLSAAGSVLAVAL